MVIKKYGRKEWPPGLGPNDFKCFGPVATKDDDFDNVKLADLGRVRFASSGVEALRQRHIEAAETLLAFAGDRFQAARFGDVRNLIIAFSAMDPDTRADFFKILLVP